MSLEDTVKKVFVAATRQNDGKTLVSLGLYHALSKRFGQTGYMKPVGQQYLTINNEKIDKDAVLFHNTFSLNDPLKDTSPIAVPSGFTEDYIMNPYQETLEEKLLDAYSRLKQDKDFILFEGTGHAGVGSVFDMSNATVASLLKTKVILVSIGGIGKCIDELMLNISLFQQKNVEILGVIINKVLPSKYEKIQRVVGKSLQDRGIRLLGTIPLEDQLTYPTVGGLVSSLKPQLLSGKRGLKNKVKKFMIGDMLPHNALDILTENTLMIIPGNREGLILTALCENMLRGKGPRLVSGIIFSDGFMPNPKILELLNKTRIPLLLMEEDAFTIATKINHIIIKIRTEDTDKILLSEKLVEDYVDIDEIMNLL